MKPQAGFLSSCFMEQEGIEGAILPQPPVPLERLDQRQLFLVLDQTLRGCPYLAGKTEDPGPGRAWQSLRDAYGNGTPALRERLTGALRWAVSELHDPQRWPAGPRSQLLALVESIGGALEPDILKALQSDRPLISVWRDDALEKQTRAGFLSALAAFGSCQTVAFWDAQFEKLGRHYAAVVLRGLMIVDVAAALARIPLLCAHQTAGETLRSLCPLASAMAAGPQGAEIESALRASLALFPETVRSVLEQSVLPLASLWREESKTPPNAGPPPVEGP